MLVHYGDHQPVWIDNLSSNKKSKNFTTYFAVDYVRYSGPEKIDFDPHSLPIFNLEFFVAYRAGLPLNGYQAAKRWMLDETEQTKFCVQSLRFYSVISALHASDLIVKDK